MHEIHLDHAAWGQERSDAFRREHPGGWTPTFTSDDLSRLLQEMAVLERLGAGDRSEFLFGMTGHFDRTRYYQTTPFRTDDYRSLMFPAWLSLLVSLVLPTAWVARRLVHRHRLAKGSCPACDYDLRATPARCPECGRAA